MSTPAFTTVSQHPTPAEADLVTSQLIANGFHPREPEHAPHITFGGANQFYSVEVPTEEAEAALEFLKTQET